MTGLSFKESQEGSIGVEIELQIIDPQTHELAQKSNELLDNSKGLLLADRLHPEITQGMIEINTSVHHNPDDLYSELIEIKQLIINLATASDVLICGGGSHPFQGWYNQKIFPTKRYEKVTERYQFLCRQATIFGQHIHIGCSSADDAIYLTHALSRYLQHFIAISCSSPFFHGADSGFCSARNTVFKAFPTSGYMPMLNTWQEFSDYFNSMKKLSVIENMKDIYWDIRPKPEFGTVEIRIFDTPLTLKKAASIAGYIQALSLYLLDKRPVKLSNEQYYLYQMNLFEASRYGYYGHYLSHETSLSPMIKDDILTTLESVKSYDKGVDISLSQFSERVKEEQCDSNLIRQYFSEESSLQQVVQKMCDKWKEMDE